MLARSNASKQQNNLSIIIVKFWIIQTYFGNIFISASWDYLLEYDYDDIIFVL